MQNKEEIEQLEAEIAKAIEGKPSLDRLQYKIDCRLSSCKSYDERVMVLATLMNENLQELTTTFSALHEKMKQLQEEADVVTSTGIFEA